MFQWFEHLHAAASNDELGQRVRELVGKLGFASFHYAVHTPVKGDGSEARFVFDGADQRSSLFLSDYPESWALRYLACGYIEVDPIIGHFAQSSLPVCWHPKKAGAAGRVRRMFDEAAEHGLGTGVTFAVAGRDRVHGLLSLTLDRDRAADRRHAEKRVAEGHLLMAHLHEAALRLNNKPEQPRLLTARERECLTWVSIGKTSWEIARILAISERTAIFHINNAVKKLNASTRTQAVARALAQGLIAP